MQVKTVKVGYLQTNCYILIKGNDCLIIDPGDEEEKIIKEISDLNVLGIIITHLHFDHIMSVDAIKNKYNAKVYDINSLEEKEYNINDFKFDVIYTKGHHITSITIYFKEEKLMFTGDFLFKESIGRTDMPTGSDFEMKKSLEKIKKYPKDIIIYPGHGDKSTLQHEFMYNYYLK
jgi:glyoxylase-like metal-dependent hydrolase (beta-lactamase superfamily II)